jgi:hypothetical protein
MAYCRCEARHTARNGRELFFVSNAADENGGNRMLAVDVTLRSTFSAGQPRQLFTGHFVLTVGRLATMWRQTANDS